MNGSECLSIILIILGIVLLLHHGYKHSFPTPENRKAQDESCPEACYFQVPDISNHETWIVVSFTNAVSLGLLGPWLMTKSLQ